MVVTLYREALESSLIERSVAHSTMRNAPAHCMRVREPPKKVRQLTVLLQPDDEVPMIGQDTIRQDADWLPLVVPTGHAVAPDHPRFMPDQCFDSFEWTAPQCHCNRCTSPAHWIRHKAHTRIRLHITPPLRPVQALQDLQTVNAPQKNLKKLNSNPDRMIRSQLRQ